MIYWAAVSVAAVSAGAGATFFVAFFTAVLLAGAASFAATFTGAFFTAVFLAAVFFAAGTGFAAAFSAAEAAQSIEASLYPLWASPTLRPGVIVVIGIEDFGPSPLLRYALQIAHDPPGVDVVGCPHRLRAENPERRFA